MVTTAFEIIKEAISLFQKMGNVDMVTKLIDAQQQTIDIQKEVLESRDEIKKFKDISELEKKIVRHNLSTIVTRNDDEKGIYFCSRCWDVDRKLVQIDIDQNENFTCPNKNCGNKGLLAGTLLNEYRKRLRKE